MLWFRRRACGCRIRPGRNRHRSGDDDRDDGAGDPEGPDQPAAALRRVDTLFFLCRGKRGLPALVWFCVSHEASVVLWGTGR